ncbi:hypothetical protein PG989_000497 [Apiospora arundinis]
MGRRRNRTSRRSAAVETQANASASAGCLPGFIPPHLQAARAGTHWATFAGSGQFKQVISSATTSRNDQATAPAFAGCAAGFVPPHLQVVRVGNGGYASPSGTPSVTSGGSSSVFRKAETAEEEQSSVYTPACHCRAFLKQSYIWRCDLLHLRAVSIQIVIVVDATRGVSNQWFGCFPADISIQTVHARLYL